MRSEFQLTDKSTVRASGSASIYAEADSARIRLRDSASLTIVPALTIQKIRDALAPPRLSGDIASGDADAVRTIRKTLLR